MLFGHLAISALQHRYLNAEFVPVMVAAVMPDAIDKVLYYGIGQTPSGRLWGHTLLVALLSSAIVLLVFGKRSATSWALGYLSHLIADIGGMVPWLYPFVTYEFPRPESFGTTLWMSLTRPGILIEILLVIWAFIAFRPILQALFEKSPPLTLRALNGYIRDGRQRKHHRVQGKASKS